MSRRINAPACKVSGAYWLPQCERCKKPVDSIEIEALTDVLYSVWYGVPFYTDSGERIMTIRCHGEIERLSNIRNADRFNHFAALIRSASK